MKNRLHIFKYILSLVSVAVIIFALYSTKQFKNENILIVGTSADYKPYAFIDIKTNEVIGFDIDVVREIAQRLGKDIQIKDIPFAMLMFDLFSGDVDMVAAGLTPTPRKAKKVNFTQLYLQGDPLIALTKKGVDSITTVQDLVGKKIVISSGYTADLYLSDKPGMTLIRLANPAQCFMALKSGSVDVFVAARSSLIPFLEQKNAADQYAMFVLPETGDTYAIAINKKNEQLLEQVNQALDVMRQDGTLEQLKKKWKLA